MSYKVLGQAKPAANTLVILYTVPTGSSTVTSTITVCNQGSATTFRFCIAVNGMALDPKQYISYDTPLPANDTIPLTLGITLAQNDTVNVSSASGNVSFNIFGAESA